MLGLLAFTPVAAMQRRFSRAQVALLGDAGVSTRLRWFEWVIVVLGCGFWAAASVGAAIMLVTADPDRAEAVWILSIVAVSVTALVLFASASSRAIAQGLAMHANPSADQISTYTA